MIASRHAHEDQPSIGFLRGRPTEPSVGGAWTEWSTGSRVPFAPGEPRSPLLAFDAEVHLDDALVLAWHVVTSASCNRR